ncbi:hypothetical protein [Paenibacillus sp. ov031]|uniref:hypothetical protein n=1 Tax=Paenibacillus sp. ov031 TaxID=1761879 RepID=UPI00147D81B4|nr:hypothetical protein [Paenibacillus sp. ov031]
MHYWQMHKSMQDTILQPMYVTRYRADRENAKLSLLQSHWAELEKQWTLQK